MKNLLKILSLNNVNEDCLIQIQAIAKTVNLKSHKNILDYGNYCNHIFFVLKGGFLCKYWNDKNESERTINFYLDTSQPFMTSIDSYFNQTKSIYSLQSFTNSDILIFKRTDLEILTNEYKSLIIFIKMRLLKHLFLKMNLGQN